MRCLRPPKAPKRPPRGLQEGSRGSQEHPKRLTRSFHEGSRSSKRTSWKHYFWELLWGQSGDLWGSLGIAGEAWGGFGELRWSQGRSNLRELKWGGHLGCNGLADKRQENLGTSLGRGVKCAARYAKLETRLPPLSTQMDFEGPKCCKPSSLN